jgi:hypothetical protein
MYTTVIMIAKKSSNRSTAPETKSWWNCMDQNQSLSTETAVYAKFLQVVVDPYNFWHALTELQLFCKDDINILNKRKFYSRCQLLMCQHDILKGGLSCPRKLLSTNRKMKLIQLVKTEYSQQACI